ncbi:hypothetical protein BDR05DRAFT_966177 [Suillus weaverae]|nr:hypothetical protein BDR05DRAFT_966177 [Suillus weaverae]
MILITLTSMILLGGRSLSGFMLTVILQVRGEQMENVRDISLTLTVVSQSHRLSWWYTIGVSEIILPEGITDIHMVSKH